MHMKISSIGTSPHYKLEGVISAESRPTFTNLMQTADAFKEIYLDFSQVTRINSMGLALLLKVLKECQMRNKNVHIKGANKMIQTLFKMTGVNTLASLSS